MVTRKDLIEAQLLRHCRRQQRQQSRGEGGGGNKASAQLLRLSLPSSQQLPPLQLPSSPSSSSSSFHSSVSRPGWEQEEQEDEGTGAGAECMMDHSTGSSVSIGGGSSRGLLQDEEGGQGQGRGKGAGKRGGGALLDFFFPSSNAGQAGATTPTSDIPVYTSAEVISHASGSSRGTWGSSDGDEEGGGGVQGMQMSRQHTSGRHSRGQEQQHGFGIRLTR